MVGNAITDTKDSLDFLQRGGIRKAPVISLLHRYASLRTDNCKELTLAGFSISLVEYCLLGIVSRRYFFENTADSLSGCIVRTLRLTQHDRAISSSQVW